MNVFESNAHIILYVFLFIVTVVILCSISIHTYIEYHKEKIRYDVVRYIIEVNKPTDPDGSVEDIGAFYRVCKCILDGYKEIEPKL